MRLFLVLFLFCNVSYAQVSDTFDDRVFYYDEFGWKISGSFGTVFADKLDLDFYDIGNTIGNDPKILGVRVVEQNLGQTLIPSGAIRLEFKPYRGLGADFEVGYIHHNLTGDGTYNSCGTSADCSSTTELNVSGNQNNILILLGGDYSFDNSSIVTPYITADVGVATKILGLDLSTKDDKGVVTTQGSISNTSFVPAGQAGAGVDFKAGPLIIGVGYNFILIGANSEVDYTYTSTNYTENGKIDVSSMYGHRVELKLGSRNSIF